MFGLFSRKIKVGIISDNEFSLPKCETNGSSGMDLKADLFSETDNSYKIEIPPHETRIVSTNISVEIPKEYEIQVRSRSGLAAKNNVFVLNSPGTIDSDYRGQISVILHNAGSEPFVVNHGDRIAQIVLQKVPKIKWKVVSYFKETVRGTGKFGSTGVK